MLFMFQLNCYFHIIFSFHITHITAGNCGYHITSVLTVNYFFTSFFHLLLAWQKSIIICFIPTVFQFLHSATILLRTKLLIFATLQTLIRHPRFFTKTSTVLHVVVDFLKSGHHFFIFISYNTLKRSLATILYSFASLLSSALGTLSTTTVTM